MTRYSKTAFSLIELLVALSVLAIVAAIIVPRFLNVRSQAAATTLEAQKNVIENAVQQFLSLGGTIGTTTTVYAGDVLKFLVQSSATGAARTTIGAVKDSSGGFGSSAISLQITPVDSATALQPSENSPTGFYWNAGASNSKAWYVDSVGISHEITIAPITGAVTFN